MEKLQKALLLNAAYVAASAGVPPASKLDPGITDPETQQRNVMLKELMTVHYDLLIKCLNDDGANSAFKDPAAVAGNLPPVVGTVLGGVGPVISAVLDLIAQLKAKK